MNMIREQIKAMVIILEDELGISGAWPITSKLAEALTEIDKKLSNR